MISLESGKMRKKRRIRFREERRSDEQSLYYILERDLDRDAIFRHHDGWLSQVRFQKGKRIDYVLRYGDKIFGIEVKTGVPKLQHFEQAKMYCNALNGIFLAYPSDRVGEALFLMERRKNQEVGLISLTLFRSHIIKKCSLNKRKSEEIWNTLFDEKRYWQRVKNWTWEKADGLPKTILKDGCFWISFDKKGRYSEDKWYRLSLTKSSWQALGAIFGANLAISLDRYFSHNFLWEFCQQIGWKSFRPWDLVQCDLVDVRTYGEQLWSYALSFRAHYLLKDIRRALKRELGSDEWQRLLGMIRELRKNHRRKQIWLEKEFIELK
jgi:hypothetical protein